MLFLPREAFPTDRVRINVLFGSELLPRGHQIDLVMQAANERTPVGPHAWFGRTIDVGATDDRDGILHRVRKHWLAIAHDVRALRRATRERYDVVMVSDKFLVAVIARVLLRTRGLPLIFWLTFPYPELDLEGARTRTARYPLLSWLRGILSGFLLYRLILPACAHVFVQTERMKRNVCRHGIEPSRVSPIVTGFGTAELAKVSRGMPGTHADRPTLAYLGTLSADRHLEILIDMLARLHRGGAAVRLLLIGNADRPRDREALENLAQRAGVADALEITGFLPHAAALSLASRADICLSPIYPSAVFEVGSPTKLVEYLALGMPVVANTHPEQRQILNDCRAGVCVPWSGRHFARGVAWLLRRSAAERAAMGARGRAWVESNRSYARIGDEVERHCLAVVARAAARHR